MQAYVENTAPSGSSCTLNWGDGSPPLNVAAPSLKYDILDHTYQISGAVTLSLACTNGGLNVGGVQSITLNVSTTAIPCIITGVTVSGASTVQKGHSITLSALVNKGPAGCVGAVSQAVTWTSSDVDTATVSNAVGSEGRVTGVNDSITPVSITATSSVDSSKSGSKAVTVTATVWQQVSSGGSHTCAVSSGSVYCWGNGGTGALGNGVYGNSSTPVRVSEPTP